MRIKPRTRGAAFLLLSLAVGMAMLPAQQGRAADGRDFAGAYTVTDVADLGAQVSLRLTVRIFNYSGSNIGSAVVTLQDSLRSGTDYGSFSEPVSIQEKESVRLSADFTISREEFSRWQTGGMPSLLIEYSDSASTVARRPIEMNPAMEGE